MLDIQFVRENPELVQEKAKQKGYSVDVKSLLKVDEEWRNTLVELEGIRAERNAHSASLKAGKPSAEAIEKGKELKEKTTLLEQKLVPLQVDLERLLHAIPNVHFDDVPIGGEELSVEVGKFGGQETGAMDHLDLGIKRGWIDFERGAKVAGAKFYFLKGDLALLENALTQYALNFISTKGFTYMSVPNMVNTTIARGTGFAPRASEQSDEYFVEGEDLSLIATAEMPLTGFHADEIIDEDKLPLCYVAHTPCYRKEAGAYGKHARGLFRVHQFNKVEMYAFVLPEHSQAMHEKIREFEEELWQSIGIPYHVINIASGDLGAPAAKKYDIEYWSKADGNYRELTSCSNCTDFQARNLNIRVRRKDGRIETLHTLNGTVVALARSLVAILEHFQTPEGEVVIPEVLRSYMGGKEKI